MSLVIAAFEVNISEFTVTCVLILSWIQVIVSCFQIQFLNIKNQKQPVSVKGLCVHVARTLNPLSDVKKCLHSCLEIETLTLPSQWPDKECQRCFAKRNKVDPWEKQPFFFNNRLSPILYCLSLPDKPFPSSSVCVLLCLSYRPLDSHNLIEIPPIRGVKSTRTLYSWKYHSKSTSTQK